jgi:sulfhydrogenase subunit beta (sulfur reductase)
MAGSTGAALVLDDGGLETLIAGLRGRGYTVIAPTVHDGAIEYAPVTSASQLPRGIGDEQAPGRSPARP